MYMYATFVRFFDLNAWHISPKFNFNLIILALWASLDVLCERRWADALLTLRILASLDFETTFQSILVIVPPLYVPF